MLVTVKTRGNRTDPLLTTFEVTSHASYVVLWEFMQKLLYTVEGQEFVQKQNMLQHPRSLILSTDRTVLVTETDMGEL